MPGAHLGLFYVILRPLRLLSVCVFLLQAVFFLAWLVHDHLLGLAPTSQIHLCPCSLCDYLGSSHISKDSSKEQ